MVETLVVHTLDALIEYVNASIDYEIKDKSIEPLIHIVSPSQVDVYFGFEYFRRKRNKVLTATLIHDEIITDRYLPTDEFNTMVQFQCDEGGDKDALLAITGLVREENVRDTGDDGISQKVTVKTGITTVGEAKVPNPVMLRPYRTFPEIEQPEGRFIFRMRNGPEAALFNADGGKWKLEAINSIKLYLNQRISSLVKHKVI